MKRYRINAATILVGVATLFSSAYGADMIENSIGMEFVEIPAGQFTMGAEPGGFIDTGGDWDESPVHEVSISQNFYLSTKEVTNAQYEEFDPSHAQYRTKTKWSSGDDESVIFVSWEEANAFCEWLSEKEGVTYRLPTEAEWEYACRAGTQTPYHTGETLPEDQWKYQDNYDDWLYDHDADASLVGGQTPPNAFGLYDMHGNVEEWCYDWYGPYVSGQQVDPVGRIDGISRVTRGGSHNTSAHYLRSSNRSGAMPEDRTWLLGFRVLRGDLPDTEPLPVEELPLVQRNVSQVKAPINLTGDEPHFKGPRHYVNIPEDSWGPMYHFHNHDPALIDCPNGDLLAIWFSTGREWSRELTILGARLRHGEDEWEPASLFFDIPDRNDHAPSFMRDDNGRLYHINGVGVAGWQGLGTIMRVSDDNGATWTKPRYIKSEHRPPMGPAETSFFTRQGFMIIPHDAMGSSTELLVSRDYGATWELPSNDRKNGDFSNGSRGPRISGIHAAVTQLGDGTLYAIGRGHNINGHSPISKSVDMGQTWTYSESPFPPFHAGQRPNLQRLNEGPLLYLGFTDKVSKMGPFVLGEERTRTMTNNGMLIKDADGVERRVYGLFAALSFDEGNTWPVRKLITPGGEPTEHYGHGWTKKFILDDTHAEPMGYLSTTQDQNNIIHVITSGNHYEMNLAWILEPMPGKGSDQ